MSAYSITATAADDARRARARPTTARARAACARSASAWSTMPPERADEADVERGPAEPGQDHRTVPLGAFTRFGCAAMYDAVCFTMICVPSNVSEVDVVK